MEEKAKRRIGLIPRFLGLALAEFLIYYIFTLLIHDFDVIYYYLYFAERFILLAIPVVAAAIMIRRTDGYGEAVKMGIYISLTRLVLFIPFFYLEYVYGMFDSLEALLLSLLSSVAAALVYFLMIILAYAIMRGVLKRGGTKYPTPLFDIGAPATRAVFLVSLLIFAINLAFEIYSTVLFIIENGTIYYVDEILLIFFSYVFLAVLLIGIHILGIVALNRGGKKE
jgi:hypothetical protein